MTDLLAVEDLTDLPSTGVPTELRTSGVAWLVDLLGG